MRMLPSFLSKEECDDLNALAMKYMESGILKIGGYPGRVTTRFIKQNKDFDFPEFVYDISKKIRVAAGIECFPFEHERGKNGINVAVTKIGGFINWHTDPRGEDGSATYRCNVITQKSTFGGQVVFKDKILPLEEGDVHCYAVSEVPHLVTESEGPTPRILWMFGAQIPLDKIQEY